MSKAFREVFPGIKYSAEVARRRFLQMPLVCIVLGDQKSGQSLSYLIENNADMNYQGIYQLLMAHKESNDLKHISKSALKDILSLAQSRRERELICYTAVISGHYTQTSAKKSLGLLNMNQQILDVERCINEAKLIRETIEDMAKTEIDGLVVQDSYYTDDSLSECEANVDDSHDKAVVTPDEQSCMIKMLRECNFNWFEFVDQLEEKKQLLNTLSTFYDNLPRDTFTERELQLIQQSYEAFQADEAQYSYVREKAERLLEGEIVSESDTDDPDVAYVERNIAVQKRIDSLKRNTQRRIAKRIAEKRYLQRKSSRSVKSITTTYPDIGSTIEEFVKECNVGADAWRRTGMLTFDGNVKVKKRLHMAESEST